MPQMKLKGSKRGNKRKKIKYLLIVILGYLIFAYTFYNSFQSSRDTSNEEFIKFLLNNGNSFIGDEYKLPKIINGTVNYLLKIDITNPVTLFNDSIIGYTQDSHEDDDLERLKEISSYISDPYKKEIGEPIVYIYNSHQLENYNNDNLSIYGITPNVLMASYLLKEKLNEKGVATIVEDVNLTEFLELNNLDFASSYKASRIFMLDKQNTYDSLKYYIDIHRDSVSGKLTTVKINNKSYARILFVVGLEHDNYKKNLDVANELNNLFEKHYQGLSRGIYKKEGEGVNGIYNQDVSENTMLIELGGVDNNIDEVMNTVNAISDVMDMYINSKEQG